MICFIERDAANPAQEAVGKADSTPTQPLIFAYFPIFLQYNKKPGMVVHTFNSSTVEAEAGRSLSPG